MADAGTRAADRAQAEMERKMRLIYRQAQREIIEKLNAHTKQMYALDEQKRAELAAGKITEQQYRAWLLGQQFAQKQWKDKVDSVATTLLTANQQANAIVEGQKRIVFGDNATYQAYALENGMGADLGFGVYDSATVTRLLLDEPELLPRKVVNGQKDIAWNKRNISNAITQGVIQGESIPAIAKRIAKQTASTNMKAMTRYARTAMTSAQNAGRMEALHEAQDMGIKVKKKWLATLDKRTRDAHAHLDGEVVDVDEPFQSDLGPIMYPGDPAADPANVYNCRCTLVYVYPEHPDSAERIDNEDGRSAGDMSYSEWKTSKIGQGRYEAAYNEYLKGKEEKGDFSEPEVNISTDKEHEAQVAHLLQDTFGGNMEIIDQKGREKKADFIWKGASWELKTAHSLNKAGDQTREAIHKMESLGEGNIIIDCIGVDIAEAYRIIRNRMRRSASKDYDVIVLDNGSIYQIFRYKKDGHTAGQ